MTVRWAMVGLGRMAAAIVPEFALADGAELVAVASRSADKAAKFAVEHGIEKSYGLLAEMLENPEIDAIYIASTNTAHAGEACASMMAGKHVLVEKSLAMTPEQVRTIQEVATATGMFCMEAMWTRFLPIIVELRKRILAGDIGEVRSMQGDLHAFRPYDPNDRLFAPELGGGALLDLGVYTTSFVHDIMGCPDEVRALGNVLANGAEGTVATILGWRDGRTASLSCSFDSYGPGRFAVMGTKGWIDVEPRFHHPSAITIHRPNVAAERIVLTATGLGYVHEIAAASADIAAGCRESDIMSLQASLEVSEILAECRRQLGI
ncbi:MAG: Gfo/Idh/MocA family protein [Propionibacteriaceae bacterium]